MEWSYDDLINWDDSIGDVPNVIELKVCHKQLTTLPLKIFKLTSLQTFFCEDNKLTIIPKEIGLLTSLKTFSCTYNKLDKLPKEIGSLVSLQELNCRSNKLTELPEEINLLTSLHTLYCWKNPIPNTQFTQCENNLAEVQEYFKLKNAKK